jgi:hypothetical protein
MAGHFFPLPRPLSIGEVLDSGFRLFRGTLLACLPYAALAVLAGQLPNIYFLAIGVNPDPAGAPQWWALYAIGFVLTLWLWSIVIVRQHAMGAGDEARRRGAAGEAARRLLPSLGLVLAYGVLVGIGLVLLVVPGLYLFVALCFAWPVLLIERGGIGESLGASLRLIRGHWWRTSIIFTAAFAALIVFYVLAGMIGVIVAAISGGADFAVLTAVTTVMVIVLGAFGGPFYFALLLAAYEDLKLRKQGTDLEQRIARI